MFFSRVNFVCWLLFGVRSKPVLSQWHVKDPGHSAKRVSGRLHLNTHTLLTQRSRDERTMPSRHSVETYEGNDLTRNSPENTNEQDEKQQQQQTFLWKSRVKIQTPFKKKSSHARVFWMRSIFFSSKTLKKGLFEGSRFHCLSRTKRQIKQSRRCSLAASVRVC